MKKILVICAHPDDESLGLGGTLALHSKNGDDVTVMIFGTGQYGRDETKKGIEDRMNQGKKACKILGVNKVQFQNYEDQKLDLVPLTELTAHIEKAIRKTKANTVYTHFWGDMNQDHRRIYEATLIATRPKKSNTVNELICFETPSSTDNNYGEVNFNPNYFVNIKKVLKQKKKAVSQYKNEILEYPHPRSLEAIENRAKFWGSKVNLDYAEAFIKIREIEFV